MRLIVRAANTVAVNETIGTPENFGAPLSRLKQRVLLSS
jgi:hypothetical protein